MRSADGLVNEGEVAFLHRTAQTPAQPVKHRTPAPVPPLAASLLLVFWLAKLCMVWNNAAPLTVGSLVAYGWQDAIAALTFAGCHLALRRLPAGTRLAWAVYWAVAIYAAINVPVARVVYTPLTPPMLRAARGPLADSMLLYATPANAALLLLILSAAAALPWLLRRAGLQFCRMVLLGGLLIGLVGPAASRRVDTRGMERNVIAALFSRNLPVGNSPETTGDWRQSRFQAASVEDLSRFAGAAGGFNVVMVSLESTAARYLALYGAASDPMPNLSVLARHALVFENAYAVYPESIKGLFSVLCSVYPAFNTPPETYRSVPCRSVAAELAGAGYRTAMFHSGRFGYLGMESIIRDRGYQTLEDAGSISGNHNSSFGVDEPATVARMLDWVDALPPRQRFFLTYLPIAGHHPYATPEPGPYPPGAEIDQYRNALHFGDASLGAMIEGLRARGLEKNTLWVIYGDHGEAFGQHTGNYGHTFLLYDENVHVPYLIAAPGLIRTQERVRKPVSLVDTAPTILDLLRLPSPAGYQGRTMLDGVPRMSLFFTDYSLGLLGLRDGPWKFVYETGSGRTKLFEIERDPQEASDVSNRQAPRADWYSQAVLGWSRAQQRHVAAPLGLQASHSPDHIR